MDRSLRHYATLLALCAMLLRGVIPLGWMPAADGGFMALCTADGLVQVAVAGDPALLDAPAPHDTMPSGQALCAFAAAGSLGGSSSQPVLPAVTRVASPATPPYSAPLLDHRPAGNALARAPPTLLNRV